MMPFEVHQPVGQLGDLLRRQDLGIQPHVAVLGAFGLQLFEPGLLSASVMPPTWCSPQDMPVIASSSL